MRSGTPSPPNGRAGRRSGPAEQAAPAADRRRRWIRSRSWPGPADRIRSSISGWQMDRKKRCGWVGVDPLYIRYHDEEWGRPVHDDRTHFEFLILEGAQAGLSWSTILRKRENYRRAFDRFDPAKVARFRQARIEALLRDPGIVRNR